MPVNNYDLFLPLKFCLQSCLAALAFDGFRKSAIARVAGVFTISEVLLIAQEVGSAAIARSTRVLVNC